MISVRFVRTLGRRPLAAIGVMLCLAPLWAAGARADECQPARPDRELAAARAAGQTVLTGAAARAFAARIKGQHVPMARADYIFLGIGGGGATMGWIDDAAAPIALRCDWEARPGTPLAALIAAAISAAPR
jgi:hypothetical protein